MVATLPRNIRLKLDQTLNQWQQWRCDPPLSRPPRFVSRFSAGVSNHSVLVEADAQFVIRIDGVRPANNSLSRPTEWRILQAAHAAGLAPCPRYYNPELGVLVCDYLRPDDLSADTDRADDLTETATLLQKIHQLPAVHQRLDLSERCTRYEKQLEHQNRGIPEVVTACRLIIQDLLVQLDDENESPVLCHNDLLGANRIISGNRLWAIDWEYCAMGSVWFDLAVIAVGDRLNVAQTQELVSAYLGRTARPVESLKFARNCFVYQYLELLWYLVNTSGDQEHRQLNLQQTLNRGNY